MWVFFMGTWSAGSFGNDDALDYVDSLTSFEDVIEPVVTVSVRPEGLSVSDACTVLAACDLLAAGLGRPPVDLPDITNISLRPACDRTLEQAKTLVDHVRASSELVELWEDEAEEWHGSLEALLIRLTPSVPYTPPEPKRELSADFIGHCYICYGAVTERDGFAFQYDDGGGGVLGSTPHRACIEAKLAGTSPHWPPDGAPMPATLARLRCRR